MAISRMQEPQQIQSGIGSLQDPRQGYFLGKIVKKAGRALKKVVKSPLGKAALIGGLGYGLGGAKFLGGEGIFAGGQGMGRFSNLLNLVRAKGTASGKPGILSSLFFDKDKNFKDGLGKAFSDSFVKLKMEEWHSYTAHFSEWEKRNTLDI